MPDYVVDSLAFVGDDLKTMLSAGTIIGSGAQVNAPARVNIRASAYSPKSKMVAKALTIEVVTRSVDGLEGGQGTTIPGPRRIELPIMEDARDNTGRGRSYYLSRLEIRDLGFGAVHEGVSATTIVRPGGTSDKLFVQGFGMAALRGSAVQNKEGASRSARNQNPPQMLERQPVLNAHDLLGAAGVEILTARMVPRRGVTIEESASETERLIRSPAKIVYYSGHGDGSSNCLALEGTPGTHTCWMYPSGDDSHPGLAEAWRDITAGAVEIFVVAGCAVLGILPGSRLRPDSGPGQSWRRLLRGSGGPAGLLLGYGSGYTNPLLSWLGSSSLDKHKGNDIAWEFGASLRQFGLVDARRQWIDINLKYRNRAASAIDSSGYFWSGFYPQGLRLSHMQ